MYLPDTLERNIDRDTAAATPYRARLWGLLATLLLLAVTVECLARAMHDHRKVTLSIEHGVLRALAIRRNPTDTTVLFAGNSLVFEDLQQDSLQETFGQGYQAYTAGVPGSTYYDWRYGVQSLLTRGSQPDIIVFSISPSQFARKADVTPVPVSVLWSPREILQYQREQNLNLTRFSELLLEHYSVYYSLRDIVRIFVRKFIPGYEAMMNDWSANSAASHAPAAPDAEALLIERLSLLRSACGANTRLMLLIPPTNQPADEAMAPTLKAAAAKLGIPVIEPVAPREWPLSSFQDDGYHLTPEAAETFSKLVANTLKRSLATPNPTLQTEETRLKPDNSPASPSTAQPAEVR